MEMLCQEKLRLFKAYVSLVRKYATAMYQLSDDIGALSHSDFEYVYKKTHDILQDISAARIKLEAHVRTHSC